MRRRICSEDRIGGAEDIGTGDECNIEDLGEEDVGDGV